MKYIANQLSKIIIVGVYAIYLVFVSVPQTEAQWGRAYDLSEAERRAMGIYFFGDSEDDNLCGPERSVSGSSELTFPTDIDDTAIENGIKQFIQDFNSNSVFVGNEDAIIASSRAADISPFLVVALAAKESGLGGPNDFNVRNANNAFGRTATPSQPNFYSQSVDRYWYKWTSVRASVDHTAPENIGKDYGGDHPAYIRNVYNDFLDSGDLDGFFNRYAPPSDGNNTALYIQNAQEWMTTMRQLSGAPSESRVAIGSTNVNQNEEYAFWYLISKGLTKEQAAGVLGNMWAESGVEPQRLQGTAAGTITPHGNVPRGQTAKAWGLVQWDPAHKFIDQAIAGGKDPDNIKTQLEFLWGQLSNEWPEGWSGSPGPGFDEKIAGDDLKQTTTLEEATKSFLYKYERPGVPKEAERIRLAQMVYEKFINANPPAHLDFSVSNPSNNCKPGDTGAENIIDDFVIYNQYDERWANKPFGSSTIAASGCGPSTIAMIVSTLTGTVVTPDTIADRFSEYYVPGAGSSWGIFPAAITSYGLQINEIGPNIDTAAAELRSGGLIIASGQGPKPFTRGGHIIALRGITHDGKILVGDSGHNDTSDKEWEPSALAGSIANMWVVRK
jgi:hypothetical protein